MNMKRAKTQETGSVILEAMIAILIFSMGILALVGMQATAINSVADAKYRSTAGFLAEQIIGTVWATRQNSTISSASNVIAANPDPTFACKSRIRVGGDHVGCARNGAILTGRPYRANNLLRQKPRRAAIFGIRYTVDRRRLHPDQRQNAHRKNQDSNHCLQYHGASLLGLGTLHIHDKAPLTVSRVIGCLKRRRIAHLRVAPRPQIDLQRTIPGRVGNVDLSKGGTSTSVQIHDSSQTVECDSGCPNRQDSNLRELRSFLTGAFLHTDVAGGSVRARIGTCCARQ